MAEPRAGRTAAITGGFVLMGGEFTVTRTSAEVARSPDALDAIARNPLLPKVALFQTTLNGAVVSPEIKAPLARKSTLVTPFGALAEALSVRLVGPWKTAVSDGAVIWTRGVPFAS